MQNRKILIVGGTSGLGLEIAKQLSEKGHDVTVTGRDINHVPKGLTAIRVDLTEDYRLPNPGFQDVIYAAGFSQIGHITDLSKTGIEEMMEVGQTGYIKLLHRLLVGQGKIDRVAYISSTSGYIPRELEPVYSAAKAGAVMFSKAFAKDEKHVNKVLVFAPSGMRTSFWRDSPEKNIEGFMDPTIVANVIIDLIDDSTARYIEWKIIGNHLYHHRLEVVSSF